MKPGPILPQQVSQRAVELSELELESLFGESPGHATAARQCQDGFGSHEECADVRGPCGGPIVTPSVSEEGERCEPPLRFGLCYAPHAPSSGLARGVSSPIVTRSVGGVRTSCFDRAFPLARG
jgi:hypothetical protein